MQVKERPMLFKAEMVRAILDGTTTQTRRVKPQPASLDSLWPNDSADCQFHEIVSRIDEAVKCGWCSYGSVGDHLWAKETFSQCREKENHKHAKQGYTYRADWSVEDDMHFRDFPWKPSIFMPRAASRITLEITNVSVERLQDISSSDAKKEGVTTDMSTPSSGLDAVSWSYAEGYEWLWKSINGVNSWAANPWVWKIEFRRIKP